LYRAINLPRARSIVTPRCTEATLLAHGFTISVLAELVLDGFATATPEIEQAGGRAIKVVRVRITDAGRRAIAG
jgi:hypothetical protein